MKWNPINRFTESWIDTKSMRLVWDYQFGYVSINKHLKRCAFILDVETHYNKAIIRNASIWLKMQKWCNLDLVWIMNASGSDYQTRILINWSIYWLQKPSPFGFLIGMMCTINGATSASWAWPEVFLQYQFVISGRFPTRINVLLAVTNYNLGR